MVIYTHCKFCACELAQAQNRYKAFCNSECKRLGRIYGTVKAMNLGFTKDPTPNRKTPRRQGTHKSLKAVSFDLVEAKDGSLHKQFSLDLVTPVSKTPLVLTGGSIPPYNHLLTEQDNVFPWTQSELDEMGKAEVWGEINSNY